MHSFNEIINQVGGWTSKSIGSKYRLGFSLDNLHKEFKKIELKN